MGGTVKLRILQSPTLTVVASTFTKISLSLGVGFAISLS